jgi:hypothetical protein
MRRRNLMKQMDWWYSRSGHTQRGEPGANGQSEMVKHLNRQQKQETLFNDSFSLACIARINRHDEEHKDKQIIHIGLSIGSTS